VRVAQDGLEDSLARLPRGFFERYTPVVAKDLLGCRLVRVDKGRRLSGTIVETEAYRGSGDPASHAYIGKTARNLVMFGEAGHAYVFFAYGFHHCLNVTTEPLGKPGAVLLRAIQPVEGVFEMVRNRGLQARVHIADGPGRLTQALRIDRSFNGEDLVTSRRLFIESGQEPARIGRSTRIGISRGTNRKWRFFVTGTPFVSSKK
jgi:DNA-3-methyladenine glycosylase